MRTLVEDVIGLDPQTLENRFWRLHQAIIAETNLNYGIAMYESRQMLSFFPAVSYKARKSLAETRNFPQIGFRFHDITSRLGGTEATAVSLGRDICPLDRTPSSF